MPDAAAPRPPGSPPAPQRPCLVLLTLDRGHGLLGLRPCGPVKPPARTPLFGARGPQVTVAWLTWRPAGGITTGTGTGTATGTANDIATDITTTTTTNPTAPIGTPTPNAHGAHTRLLATGLHPLPADALQWRGEPDTSVAGQALYSLVREADFAAYWAHTLPTLQAEGWAIDVQPGFAHAAQAVAAWQIQLQPLTQPRGMGSWMLSLGVELQTRDGRETFDLVPLMARLIRHDRRWTDADALEAIPDDALIRLHAPGGRLIDAEAAPLKAIARAMLDLLTAPSRRKADEPLQLSSWEAQRLAQLRIGLKDAMASHPSARRDWLLQGDAGLQWLDSQASGQPPPPVAPPSGLGITLRAYQQDGLAWLQHLRRHALAGILADDMGLGKTAQALAHVLVEQQAGRLDRPVLIVAPASLVFNWQVEAARVAPALKLLTLQGPRRPWPMCWWNNKPAGWTGRC